MTNTQTSGVRAAVLRDPRGEFQIEQVRVDAPRPDEVGVRIVGVGLCHTDIAVRDGVLPFPLPAILGHEGAGVVEQVGANITDIAVGDHVVLTFRSCGACAACGDDEPAYCDSFGPLNFAPVRPDGSSTVWQGDTPIAANFFGQSSFATHVVAHRRNVVKVPADVPLALLGPLACGVQTGAGAVMRSFDCPAGSSILVIGGGGVGLSAVLGAVARGCSTIILSEPHEARRMLACDLGATHVIDPMAGPMAEAVRGILPEGVNFVLDTTGISAIVESAVTCLAVRGVCGLVGAPSSMDATIAVPMALLGAGRTVRGIVEGDSDPERFIPELISLYKAGRFPFDRLITTYPFADINIAMHDQHKGLCVKPVLLLD